MLKERLGQEEKQSASFAKKIITLKTQAQVEQASQDTPTVKDTTVYPKPSNGITSRNRPTPNRSALPDGGAQIDEHRLGPDLSTPEREPAQSPSGKNARPSPAHQVNRSEKQSYATVAAAQPTETPSQAWTKVTYNNRKNGVQKSPTLVKAEHYGRRILFPRKNGSHLKSEADLMLALNEALQKAGVESKVRFCRVRYAPSGLISALLTEKANANMLLPQRSNLLIRAAKTVDDAVIGVEVLEQWQRLKVHGMSLERFLGPGRMDLLRREIESSTGVQLQVTPRWLINESRLKEQQELNDKWGSAIVITVRNEIEAKRIMARGLRFGGSIKKVEKYWDAGPGSVCMRCCGIGHERQGNCGDRPEKCMLCAWTNIKSLERIFGRLQYPKPIPHL